MDTEPGIESMTSRGCPASVGECDRTLSHPCRTCACCLRRNNVISGRSGGTAWIPSSKFSLYRTSWVFFIVLLLHIQLCCSALDPPSFTPDMQTFQDDQGTTRYFRYLTLDGDRLYIGAQEYVYRLNIRSSEFEQSVELSDAYSFTIRDSKADCVSRGKNETFECRNHIRAIVPKHDNIYVCGTGAFDPIDITLKNDLQLLEYGQHESGHAKCPFDPAQLGTMVYVAANSSTYSATYMASEPIIYRPGINTSELMRTVQQNSKWLNEPTFVGSFEVDQYVYFFLRESALEYMNCGKAIYSRVARVCKNDKGSTSTVLKNHWTTYLKARLNCSLPGEYPFYFHEIRDVVQSGNNFVGVFTTNRNGLHGSAVCSFSKSAIEAAFNGPFKEQSSADSNWLKVPQDRIPDPRPGSCNLDSLNLDYTVLQFIKARPLMDEAVAAEQGQPLFHEAETVYTHIAVDKVGWDYRVFFLATDAGEVQKVVQWMSGDEPKSRVLSIWKPFAEEEQIWQMKLYTGSNWKYLYLATDSQVVQLEVKQCSKYSMCTQCIQDPYCGWDSTRRQCVNYAGDNNGLIQDVTNESQVKACNTACRNGDHVHNVMAEGDAVHLNCLSDCEPSKTVSWYRDGRDLNLSADPGKYFVTRDNGLVLLDVKNNDAASYTCRSEDIILVNHEVKINACSNPEDCWRDEFRKWCNEFDVYKAELDAWREQKSTCTRGD